MQDHKVGLQPFTSHVQQEANTMFNKAPAFVLALNLASATDSKELGKKFYGCGPV